MADDSTATWYVRKQPLLENGKQLLEQIQNHSQQADRLLVTKRLTVRPKRPMHVTRRERESSWIVAREREPELTSTTFKLKNSRFRSLLTCLTAGHSILCTNMQAQMSNNATVYRQICFRRRKRLRDKTDTQTEGEKNVERTERKQPGCRQYIKTKNRTDRRTSVRKVMEKQTKNRR